MASYLLEMCVHSHAIVLFRNKRGIPLSLHVLDKLVQTQHSFLTMTLAHPAGVRNYPGRGSGDAPCCRFCCTLLLPEEVVPDIPSDKNNNNLLSRKAGTVVFFKVKMPWHALARLWALSTCLHQQATVLSARILHTALFWLHQKNLLRVDLVTWLLLESSTHHKQVRNIIKTGKVLLLPRKGPKAMRSYVVYTTNLQIFGKSVAGEKSCSDLILWKELRDNYEGTIIAHCSYPI